MVQILKSERMAEDDGKRRAGWLINGCFGVWDMPIVIVPMAVPANLQRKRRMGFVKPWAPGILKKASLMKRRWMG
jgi:hypothetical protein